MTTTRRFAALPLACLLAGASFVLAAGGAAQDHAGEEPFSLRAAIEEVRRTPFHAPHAPWIPAIAPDGFAQPASHFHPPTQTADYRDRGVSGGNIFFLSLPVVAVIDVLALSEVGDEGFGIDPLVSLGAIAAPTLIARLLGARSVFALAGSVMGFGSGALVAKAFDKFGVFVAPALHAGATAIASVLGDRAR